MLDTLTTDYRALLGIATAAVFEIASPSARSNITEAVAAQAVEQYLIAVDRGDEIRNPHGWVQVTARRRAIDAMRRWTIEKRKNLRVDVDGGAADVYMVGCSNRLVRHVEGCSDGFDGVHADLWIKELIGSTIADPINREIAGRCIVGGEKPGAIAAELGLEAPAVSSRLMRIKSRLKHEISIEDLRT